MIPVLNYNADPESSFIRTERLKIPYMVYSQNPKKAVRELLGQDINIKNIFVNDIITDDECFIVDVEYTNLKFSPYEIVFVDVKDVKPVIPNGTKYAINYEGCNVSIKIPSIQDFKTMIPIRISPILQSGGPQHDHIANMFGYFGTIVRRPMNSLCTPLEYPGHQFTPYKLAPIKKLYPEGYKLKKSYSLEEMKEAYKSEVQEWKQLKNVDTIAVAKSFADCKFGTTGYLIDFKLIPLDHYLNGIIFMQPKRVPTVVLYFPTTIYKLCVEELESLKSFIEMDEVNALNFDYVMN